ncbi:MFS transporter [Phyllobacterium sp. 21LDTY02-6]|uniref:YbfB/YjiJ family MFS transporter n=1 Tax=unclassified Phyllobacterium TaxID=2638441 RepID=UPI0020229A18|nr:MULTISPECIES: YbfB/YjiJ family MFS transporter [unclassified Phyllobacterium]MCO4318538.1 MFS transporter [Phyllobacterium sp. 21LDTY02-6]MCX8281052.1 YbfB/YjiJ family MFS transporter [Phyllobacterium sp. 0TCS1.6C]MCX8294661.1 YbfB/YjiJ family MFS transporter [Phyllobacterium sp. 0TCS1.6A]
MNQSSATPLRYSLGGLVAMAVGMGIGRFIYTPILPGMMSDLGLSPSDAGIIASANFLGYLVGAVVAGYGWAAGRERGVMLASLGLSAALCLAMGISSDVLLLSLIRFLAGVASALMLVFAATIVFSHLGAARRLDLQAVHFGGVGTGIALSALLVAAGTSAGYGWRADWMAAGLVSFAGLLAVALLIRDGPVRDGSGSKEPAIRWTAAFVKLNIAYALFGIGYVITATFIIAIVRDSNGGPFTEALVWLCTGLAGIVSVWAWNPVLRRVGPFRSLALSLIALAAGVSASVIVPSPIGPLIGGLLLGFTIMVITAFAFQAGRELVPLAPRRMMAITTAAFGIGQIVGPLIGGYLADVSGSFTSATLLAAAGLVIGAYFAYSAEPEARS